MHQTTCQIARETGIHHSSVYSIIHQDFQLISLKKRRAQELTTINCVYQSDLSLVLQGKVGAHYQVWWEYNISFVANFLTHVIVKKYKNWFTNKKVTAKIKRVQFFKHSVQTRGSRNFTAKPLKPFLRMFHICIIESRKIYVK